jgi:hypothetical protein
VTLPESVTSSELFFMRKAPANRRWQAAAAPMLQRVSSHSYDLGNPNNRSPGKPRSRLYLHLNVTGSCKASAQLTIGS